MDVWTLGIILLHCMCLDYKKREEEKIDTFDDIFQVHLNIRLFKLKNLIKEFNLKSRVIFLHNRILKFFVKQLKYQVISQLIFEIDQ